MKLVLSWLKDYVDIDLSIEELARLMTMIGLEVEDIQLVGIPKPEADHLENVYEGLAWDPEKIVVAEVTEVMPHPNADRLVLCKLNDGKEELVVLTGAPNLYEYKGKGPLSKPLKVACAREGSTLYDGHKPGKELTTLKRMKIRGVESFSMICSEKELGISEEHEGVILLDDDAPVGMPLVDYMGDVVFQVAILPNMVRDACMFGAAREIAAATNKPLKQPKPLMVGDGPSIEGQVKIEIKDPSLNPRFVFGLVRGASAKPSPYWVQKRLRLAGMRPINSTVDATNYVMLEVGEPLHAFDYDVLKERAKGKTPTIITRAAKKGEKLVTLDEIERELEEFTVLVTDTAGPLALAGVMGGLESEVTENTTNVLLEGASWNFINTRRTVVTQKLPSEAGYRFSRNIHPALAKQGVELCLSRIAEWSGGEIAAGLVDEYPQKQQDPIIEINTEDVERVLGITLSKEEIVDYLQRLEFKCTVKDDVIKVQTPAHRMDVSDGVIGRADLMEEIARLYGYDRIPASRLADSLPPQQTNKRDDLERKMKSSLVNLGLQETINYRLTSPEEEARMFPGAEIPGNQHYLELKNPISLDKRVLRTSLIPQMLTLLEKNMRHSDQLILFELGPVFLSSKNEGLPNEETHLCIGMTGTNQNPAWDRNEPGVMDFYDLKGYVQEFLTALHIEEVNYSTVENPVLHPGKGASVLVNGKEVAVMGLIHPVVNEQYDFNGAEVYIADFNLEVLQSIIPEKYSSKVLSAYPPVLEDLAVIVPEEIPAVDVEEAIRKAGEKLLTDVVLFDVFKGEQIGAGNKSLAYNLTFQSYEKTLTDKNVEKIRNKIIGVLENKLKATVRKQ